MVDSAQRKQVTPVALTIAGSDPSGGAGIQADLKTFHQLGVYGTAVITLLTVQNTRGIRAIIDVDGEEVIAQLEAVVDDIPPKAAKTGALGDGKIIHSLANYARTLRFPLVVDPVMISKSGQSLIADNAVEVLKKELLPHATLVTPNLEEASALTGTKVGDLLSMEVAARRISEFGPKAVLVKGGHLRAEATDVLFYQNKTERLYARKIETKHTHGTGCTYSAAITAELAKGKDLVEAVHLAKQFVTRAIESAPGLGRGIGPVNHHA